MESITGSLGNLATKDSVTISRDTLSVTSGTVTIEAGKGASCACSFTLSSGYQICGIYRITTNHNVACVLTGYNWTVSGTTGTLTTYYRNVTTANITDLKATASVVVKKNTGS